MISPVSGGAATRLRVTILHNYRDEQQPSMRLYAQRLGEALLRRNVQVTRVRPPSVVPSEWRARSTTWAKIDAYAGRFAVYPRLVEDVRSDVTHVIDHGQGYLLSRLDPHRTVVTCHDVILLALAAGRLGPAPIPQIALTLFRISMKLMKTAASIVADSEHTRQDLIDFVECDPAKITVIHPGLNQPFRPDAARGRAFRQRFGIPDGLLMLQIGRGFYKNLPSVLRVLQRLRAGGIDVKVLRVGPPLNDEERRLAETLAVTGAIVELGGIPDSELPALYNAVDLLLFPSLYEGFGWPPLEAMASGLPVVCSRAGSLDEIVADAALTADPEDVEGLAWHAATVLTDARIRDSLVQRGAKRAAQFTWESTAAKMVGVYTQVMGAAS
jgi:glycosyltransferase involved in cell wall biosynthesis